MTESQPEKLVFKDSERESGQVLTAYLREALGVELPSAPDWEDVLDVTAEQFARFADKLLADQPWEEPTVVAMGDMLDDKEIQKLRVQGLHRMRRWVTSGKLASDNRYEIRQFGTFTQPGFEASPFYLFLARYQLPLSSSKSENVVATYIVNRNPAPNEQIIDRIDMPGGRSPKAGALLADMLEVYNEPRTALWRFRPHRFNPEASAYGGLPRNLPEHIYHLLLDNRLESFAEQTHDALIIRARDDEADWQVGIHCDGTRVLIEEVEGIGEQRSGMTGSINFQYNSCMAWERTAWRHGRTQYGEDALVLISTALADIGEHLLAGNLIVPNPTQNSDFYNSELRTTEVLTNNQVE